jgi:hypothetical protein
VRTKPRSIGDLPLELLARAKGLSKSKDHLLKAALLLADHYAGQQGASDSTSLATCLPDALAELSSVESLLRDDLRDVRLAVKILERQEGSRKSPGRPRVVTDLEARAVRRVRDVGRWSWEQILRELNKRRGKDRPPLQVSTLRSAVRRLAVQTPRPNKR